MKRIFVEKRKGFAIESESLTNKIETWLGFKVNNLRIINVYDVENIDEKTFKLAISSVFADPSTDDYSVQITLSDQVNFFAVKSLAAQFDVRSDSAEQCIKLINPESNPKVWTSKLYIFDKDKKIGKFEINKMKKMLINKVEMEEKNLALLGDRISTYRKPIKSIDNFTKLDDAGLEDYARKLSLTLDDLRLIQNYYLNIENKNPTETELLMLGTYWSDHCRHTTFETIIDSVEIEDQPLKEEIQKSLDFFNELRKDIRKTTPFTLMNLATIMPKYLEKNGTYLDIETSDEVNASAFFQDVKIDDQVERWLIQFKNETHNHPTEIEPFGGAATCLGGAIRDPLAGRAFVYQGARVTGAGDPTEKVSATLPNKLPQRKISQVAALGFSSYGNQIGIATALVEEISHKGYNSGYRAKRLEAGVVVGASPSQHVVRQKPEVGDLIILLGGKTGRDGIGGATGSSKVHNDASLWKSTAEVQKGNAPEERKIQRLFKRFEVSKLIKKANDFGAGGIATALCELADSVRIDLNKVPLKYAGLNGTEIALSESQERMAVIIDPQDWKAFNQYCNDEGIEATAVGQVTNNHRIEMLWESRLIVDISREFLNTFGAQRHTLAVIKTQDKFTRDIKGQSLPQRFEKNLQDLNVASQKGLQQLFDFSIGNSTVLAPYGGKFQLSPSQVSIQKLPVDERYTDVATMLSFGFDPYVSSASPFLGGVSAVVESLAKIVAAGGTISTVKLSFQEYFEYLGKDYWKWGKPLAALLGTLRAMKEFNVAAIGGKDSMSGTFKNLNVPPTLISFALSVVDANNVISTDFKKEGNGIYLLDHDVLDIGMLDLSKIKNNFETIEKLIKSKRIVSAFAISKGGLGAALAKMSFGNNLGFEIKTDVDKLFEAKFGAILVESKTNIPGAIKLGTISKKWKINSTSLDKEKMFSAWSSTFEQIFPTQIENKEKLVEEKADIKLKVFKPKVLVEKPVVLIPVFPGTNCEFDIKRKFAREGAICKEVIFRNLNEAQIKESLQELAYELKQANIFVLAGGFSAGDEPDGAGKFIVNVLRSHEVSKALDEFRQKGGLTLGICNGFQALVKSGLLPFGELKITTSFDSTLFKNDINAHVAKYVRTKVSSINSPWLKGFKLNEIHTVPISNGEGKFVVNKEDLQRLIFNGQIAFQYVDDNDKITMDGLHNPSGSDYAIEGIVSHDGMILGKMAHSERYENNIAKNIYGGKDQNIFRNAVKFFSPTKRAK